MTDTEKAYEQLKRGIEIAIQQALNNAHMTQVKTAYIVSSKQYGSNYLYSIQLNNGQYSNIHSLSTDKYLVNTAVEVIIPNGNMDEMFILGQIK